QLLNDDSQIVLTTAGLAVGIYHLNVNRAGITDRAGNALGTGTFTSNFIVQVQLIQNGGFETGNFTGWTITPSSGGTANVVSSWVAIPSDGTVFGPKDGTRFAVLKTGLVNVYEMVSQQFT